MHQADAFVFKFGQLAQPVAAPLGMIVRFNEQVPFAGVAYGTNDLSPARFERVVLFTGRGEQDRGQARVQSELPQDPAVAA